MSSNKWARLCSYITPIFLCPGLSGCFNTYVTGDPLQICCWTLYCLKVNSLGYILSQTVCFVLDVMVSDVPSRRRISVSAAEQGMGRWVMGQMGHENQMGHMGHRSLGVDPWPISFLTLWLGLYIMAMIIYRVTLWCMCNCACSWRSSKFTFTFKFMLVGLPRVSGYPSGTRVINYHDDFLLPDGYPGSEYIICRIYLIGLISELVQ